MIATESQPSIKNHVYALIVLNMLDGILTYIGITSGFITEGNPLLSSLSPLTILLGKLVLSLCLYGLLFTSFASIQSRMWRYGLIAANTLYSMILLMHLLWLCLLFL